MNDERPLPNETSPPRVSTTKHSDFTRFLDNVAPEKACPECGINDWLTSLAADQEGKDDPILQVAAVPGVSTAGSLPLHTLHCANCGFTKFFVASIVDKWVNKNG